ncbi:DUF1801 domain-containing protein, partial [Leptospira sp. 96542]|nr:DUF1801 domain-containing protein [Leptospira sp. 96542]
MNEMKLSSAVADFYFSLPSQKRDKLFELRSLIFEVAKDLPEIGSITECIKWGQPSYLAEKKTLGTPIRLGLFGDSELAIFVHCQTTLIAQFRKLYPNWKFSGNRAIIIPLKGKLAKTKFKNCFSAALLYHQKK